jgi:site-specific recombinase XerD
MDLRTAKRIFLSAKEAQGVTKSTYRTYACELTKFFDFLVTRNIFDVSEITADIIREFLNSLKANGLRNITIHRHWAEIKNIILFLYREDYITHNPIKNVKPPKAEQKKMRTFTGQEISKLLNSFDKSDFFGMRNYCIMATFFSTGMRKMELLNLRVADLNITNDLLRIEYGKGNKERYVPIGKTLRRIFIQYLKMREDFLEDEQCKYLFSSRTKRKMTNSGIDIMFQKLKKELNLTGEKVSSHTWRHTFAKNYLLNGGDVFSLQKIMGHADLDTTRQYLNLNVEEIKMQHAKYNPLDNKDWLY